MKSLLRKEFLMWAKRLMWILWPAFLAACAMEMLVFGLVDPSEIQWQGAALGWSRQAFYTLSFFVFRLVISGASALTCVLGMGPAEINGWDKDAARLRAPAPALD
jgi:hypothetical protein